MMLGARVTSGLRVALEEPERVDSLFLDRVAVPISERVRLIAAEESMEADIQATEEGARRVVEMLRQRFNHVVIDLPIPPGPVERMVLQRLMSCWCSPRRGIRDTAPVKLVSMTGSAGRVITVLNGAGCRGYPPIVAEGIGAMPGGDPDLRHCRGWPSRLPGAARQRRCAAHSACRGNRRRPLADRPRSFLARLFGRLTMRTFGRRSEGANHSGADLERHRGALGQYQRGGYRAI